MSGPQRTYDASRGFTHCLANNWENIQNSEMQIKRNGLYANSVCGRVSKDKEGPGKVAGKPLEHAVDLDPRRLG